MRRHRFHFLLHAAALLEDALRRRLAALHVRPRQARILDALARMGEASQSELARDLRAKLGGRAPGRGEPSAETDTSEPDL